MRDTLGSIPSTTERDVQGSPKKVGLVVHFFNASIQKAKSEEL
jgi:hypothetical protein